MSENKESTKSVAITARVIMAWFHILGLLVLSANVHGFQIQSKSAAIKVVEGQPISIWCKATNWFQTCEFHHRNEVCSLNFDVRADGYLKTEKCFENQRFQPIKDYDGNKCGVRINHAQLQDSGLWECHMNYYYDIGRWSAKVIEVQVLSQLSNLNQEDSYDWEDYQSDQGLPLEQIRPEFKIEAYAKGIQAKQGGHFDVWCKSNLQFKNCTLSHGNNSCTFEYMDFPKSHIKVRDCDRFFWRTLHFNKDYDKGECGIRVTDANPKKEGGLWTCHMNSLKKQEESDARKMHVNVL